MMIPFSYWGGGGGGLPYTPPLDVNNAAAAYSIRKLRTAYAGNCMLIHNSASGTFTGVGFDSNGYLDIANSPLLNGDDWRVRTWYDQTGNGLDMTTSNYSSAPRIANAGVLEEINSLAALSFEGNDLLKVSASKASFNFLHDGTKSSVYIVTQVDGTDILSWLIGNGGASGEIGIDITHRDTATDIDTSFTQILKGSVGNIVAQNIGPNNEFPRGAQKLFVTESDADNATAADRLIDQIDDGSLIQNNTNTNSPTGANASNDLIMGVRPSTSNQFYLNGFMQEVIIFDTDQSANKSTLQTNINDYFSIY